MRKYKMMGLKNCGRVKEVSRQAAALTVPVADLAAAAREGMGRVRDAQGGKDVVQDQGTHDDASVAGSLMPNRNQW